MTWLRLATWTWATILVAYIVMFAHRWFADLRLEMP